MASENTRSSKNDDPELSVSEEDGHTVVEALLRRPAAQCYRFFTDADRFKEWLMVVGTAVVRERDAQGRAVTVDFMGSLKRASVSYTLSYDYDEEAHEVRWECKGGSMHQLKGSARFIPVDEGSCRLRYRLATMLPGHLPPWEDEMYRAKPAETVILDFCDWLDHDADRGATP